MRLWGGEFKAPLKTDGVTHSWDVKAMGRTYQVAVPSQPPSDTLYVTVEGQKIDLTGNRCVRWLIDQPGKKELFISNRADCVGKLLGQMRIAPSMVRGLVDQQDAKASGFRGQKFDIEQQGIAGFQKERPAMRLETQLVSLLTGVSEAELNAFLHYETRFDIAAVNLELDKTLPLIRQTGMYQKWQKKFGAKIAEERAIAFIRDNGFGDRGIGHFFKEVRLRWDEKKKEQVVSNAQGEGETWTQLTTEGEFAYLWKEIFGDKPVPRRGKSYFVDVLATACLMRRDSQRHNLPLKPDRYYPKARRLAYRGLGNQVKEVSGGNPTFRDDEPNYASLVTDLHGQLLAMNK